MNTIKFISPDLQTILAHFDKIQPDTRPQWGVMNAHQMAEHITDSLLLAQEKIQVPLAIPEEKISEYLQFMLSNKPIPKGSASPYPILQQTRNENFALALDELAEEWIAFEDFFEKNPQKTTLHPYFGQLDFDKWCQFHAKHLTHHLTQFGIEIFDVED
jgi:hypothetical protein